MSVEIAAAAAAAGDHVIRWGNKIRETGDTNNNYTGDIVPDQHDQRMDGGDCGSHSLAVPEIGQYLGWAAVLRDIIAVGITFFGPLRGGGKTQIDPPAATEVVK